MVAVNKIMLNCFRNVECTEIYYRNLSLSLIHILNILVIKKCKSMPLSFLMSDPKLSLLPPPAHYIGFFINFRWE